MHHVYITPTRHTSCIAVDIMVGAVVLLDLQTKAKSGVYASKGMRQVMSVNVRQKALAVTFEHPCYASKLGLLS